MSATVAATEVILPDLRPPRAEWEGDRVGHTYLAHRVAKYGMTATATLRDGDNLFRAVRESARDTSLVSHADWRRAVCDHMAGNAPPELVMLLPKWRQQGNPVDHRVLPYVAAVLDRVVVVWPAQTTRQLFFYPPACTIDTHAVYFKWFNQEGAGPLDTFEPMYFNNPMGDRDLRVGMLKNLREHIQARTVEACTHGGVQPREVPHICSPLGLRQVDTAHMEAHQAGVMQGVEEDARWGMQHDASAELCDANIGEFIHAIMDHCEDTVTFWAPAKTKMPRVWVISPQLDVKLQEEGVGGVQSWGRTLDLSALELIFIPINHPGAGVDLEGGHWTVLVVRVREGLIQSFDSFVQPQCEAEHHPHAKILQRAEEWLQHLSDVTSRRLGCSLSKSEQFFGGVRGIAGCMRKTEVWQHAHEARTIQRNNRDCGVHAAINIVRTLEGGWRGSDFEDIPRVRMWMFQVIVAARGRVTQGTLPQVVEESDAIARTSDEGGEVTDRMESDGTEPRRENAGGESTRGTCTSAGRSAEKERKVGEDRQPMSSAASRTDTRAPTASRVREFVTGGTADVGSSWRHAGSVAGMTERTGISSKKNRGTNPAGYPSEAQQVQAARGTFSTTINLDIDQGARHTRVDQVAPPTPPSPTTRRLMQASGKRAVKMEEAITVRLAEEQILRGDQWQVPARPLPRFPRQCNSHKHQPKRRKGLFGQRPVQQGVEVRWAQAEERGVEAVQTKLKPEVVESSDFFALHQADLDNDEYAIKRMPRGTYYPVEKLMFRNWNGKQFMVRWKGFRPGRKGQGGDDEWASRANLMQDIPTMVLAFERACRFDPMEPPAPRAGVTEGVGCGCGCVSGVGSARPQTTDISEEMVEEDGVHSARDVRVTSTGGRGMNAGGCCATGSNAGTEEVAPADAEAGTRKEAGTEGWDTVTTRAGPLSWDELAEEGVWVDPEDRQRAPPQVSWVSHNFWRTPRPQPNRAKLPTKHGAATTRHGAGTQERRAPAWFQRGTVCQNSCEQMRECERECTVNANVSNRVSTAFMLKYHDGKQWGLHALRTYGLGDCIDEYRGEVIDGQEGDRRRREKIATSPSYLLQMGPRVVDAEEYGNAMRFLNHQCVAPNCRFEQVWVEGRLQIHVIAIRPIGVGEELTVAYGFDWAIGARCHCGHDCCGQHMGEEMIYVPGTEQRIPRRKAVVPGEWVDSATRIMEVLPTVGMSRRQGRLPETWEALTRKAVETVQEGAGVQAGDGERAKVALPTHRKYPGGVRFPHGLSL